MKTSSSGSSFFRDFVDDNDLILGNALLTEEWRNTFNGVKFEIRGCLKEVFRKLPQDRERRLLRMSMIKHAVSQILYEIARDEDSKTSA